VSDKLRVITDMLRELGMEREATWVEQREHVATLLKQPMGEFNDDGMSCSGCGCDVSFDTHFRACPVAAAWHVLGDPRGAENIERAHEEALRRERTRIEALNPGELTSGAQRALFVARMLEEGLRALFSVDAARDATVSRAAALASLVDAGRLSADDYRAIMAADHIEPPKK